MELKQAAIFLSLAGIVMCMQVQKLDKADKHRNALYFEAHEQSLVDSNADTKPNFMLPNSVCPNSTYTCSNNLTCCVGVDKTVSCCPILMVSSDVICPGGATECPAGSTCCRVALSYTCCPIPKATCCSDGIHCCPQYYKCNVTTGACMKVQDWLTKTPTKPVKKTICTDNSHCPFGSTCCKLESGQNGCCPLFSVVCPGGRSQCPDGTTCCKMKTGDYGCCPYQLATCCSDGLHCCPEGYKCDLKAELCVHKGDTVNWLEKLQATPVNATVTCQDDTVCPNDNTCCELGSSEYGCCPLKEAVCCSDHAHCCPEGYQCDVPAGTCSKGSEALAWLTRKPSRSAFKVV